MATDLIEIDPERPSMRAIERAAAAVRRGEVVAIPTDVLYTLVADPLNLHAVGRVFAAKGRESIRSLPLLVSDIVMAEELASEVSARFYLLARRFWPGPLTIIAPASSRVPLKVTGNTGRLALRQSQSKVANALLERLSQPLIATSANLARRRDGGGHGRYYHRRDRGDVEGDQGRRDPGEGNRGRSERQLVSQALLGRVHSGDSRFFGFREG